MSNIKSFSTKTSRPLVFDDSNKIIVLQYTNNSKIQTEIGYLLKMTEKEYIIDTIIPEQIKQMFLEKTDLDL